MRGIGVADAIQSVFPDVLAGLVAVLTHLGDPAVAVAILVPVYWFGDRTRGARILGVVAGGLALVLAVKLLLALPRPPVEPPAPPESVPGLLRGLYRGETYADGFGFPSGHAATATVTWGTLALALRVGTRRRRLLVAGAIVAVVALSRIVLGVHYLADVVAGTALGVAYLFVVLGALDRLPAEASTRLALGVGTTLAVVAVLVGPTLAGVLGLGSIAGAFLAWLLLDVPRGPWPRSPAGVARAVAGLAVAAVPAGVAALAGGSTPMLGIAACAGTGLAVGFPGILVAVGVDSPGEGPGGRPESAGTPGERPG